MPRLETLREHKELVASVGGSVLFETLSAFQILREAYALLLNKDFNPIRFNRIFVSGLIGLCNELTDADYKVILVTGGGKIARMRINDARQYGDPPAENFQLDHVGISESNANAAQLLAVLQRSGVPANWYSRARKGMAVRGNVEVRGGDKPGSTTDMITARLAVAEKVKTIVNISATPGLHPATADGNFNAREVIQTMSLKNYLDIYPVRPHQPGQNSPLEPQAARYALNHGLTVALVGTDMANLKALINGQSFNGTVLTP